MASLAEVGQALKEAREELGLSLEEVSSRTRITVRHLRALETGSEADLPELFYIRAFLKKYADAVGLSPNDVADAYRAAPAPTISEPSGGFSLGPIAYYLLLFLAFGAILALAWYFQPRVSVVTEPSPVPSAEASLLPSPGATSIASPDATATAAATTSSPGAAPSHGPAASAKPSTKPSSKPSPKSSHR